jgi:hypothetical protein
MYPSDLSSDLSVQQESLAFLCSLTRGQSGDSVTTERLSETGFRKVFLEQLNWHQLALHIDLSGDWAAENLPVELTDEISQMKLRLAANALKHTYETIGLVQHLNQAGINVLCLKGNALSQQLYDSPVKRHTNDIDLFTRLEDVPDTVHLLCELGYRCNLDKFLEADFFQAYTFLSKDVCLYHPDKRIVLELHWRLETNPTFMPLTFDQAWKNRDQVTLAGQAVPVPGHVDNIVYIACHGTRSHWARMKWVLDWQQILTDESVEWDQVFDQARHYGKEIYIRNACDNAQYWFGPNQVTLPEEFDSRRARRLFVINLGCQLQCEYPSVMVGVVNRLRLARRPGGLWEEYRRTLGTSTIDLTTFRLTGILFPLHYLLRPILYLVRKFGGST